MTGHLPKKANRTLRIQILFTVLSFLLMTVLSYVFMSSIVRDGLLRTADSTLDFAEERVASDLRDARLTLKSFSSSVRGMLLRGVSADDLKTYIADLSYYSSLVGETSIDIKDFYGYFESFPDGPLLLHSNTHLFPGSYQPEEFPWYRPAIEAGGNTVETTPYINSAGEAVFTYAESISDEGGRLLGVVCVDVRIDTIGREIVETALNQGGYGMLVNQDLLILSHPNTDFEGRYLYDQTVPLRIFSDELAAGGEILERSMISYLGEDSVVFFRDLPNGWHLGLVTPRDQYYAGMGYMAATLGALGAALAAALIVILIRIDSARSRSDDESKKKSMFLANMSHEIRTPINAIVGMTAIGRAAGTTERKDYCFSKIDNASKHLLGVVNDILDISKIEANKIELSPADFQFEKMLQQAVNVVNFRVDEKRQKLSIHIDRAIPRVLFADDQRFAQVITNLLSNAVKFTPEEGSVSLNTSFVSEQDGVCTVRVEVTDTGIGISPAQQKRLFQSFSQAESSTTRRYGGTGLGLAISKSIVEMMGGEIYVQSALGEGSTIGFTVKVKRGDESIADISSRNINWKNVRLLAVDDDPDILLYFKDIVSGFGTDCATAANAAEALRLVEENGDYNIYFVDLRMPGVDGIELTRMLREREKEPGNSVVIMISSADLSSVESEAKKAGVDKFLLKPLFPSAIADVISECIGIVSRKMDEKEPDIRGIFAGRFALVAEDVEINREIVLTLLEPTLLEIDCAENGREALEMFRRAPEKYDMIFMDVQMPEMDGYDATRRIRMLDLPRARTVPIVAMTANVFREDIDNCIAAGMNSHLGKPLDMDDLIATASKYLLPKS